MSDEETITDEQVDNAQAAAEFGQVLQELAWSGWTVKLQNGIDNRWRLWLRWQQGVMPDDGYREESTAVSNLKEAADWFTATSEAWEFDD